MEDWAIVILVHILCVQLFLAPKIHNHWYVFEQLELKIFSHFYSYSNSFVYANIMRAAFVYFFSRT